MPGFKVILFMKLFTGIFLGYFWFGIKVIPVEFPTIRF